MIWIKSVTKSQLEYVNLTAIHCRWLPSIGKEELNSVVGQKLRNGILKQQAEHMVNTDILEMRHCPVGTKILLCAFIDSIEEGGF